MSAGPDRPGSYDPRPARSVFRLYLFALLGWTFDFYDLVLLGFLMDPVARDLGLSAIEKTWLLGVALGASGLGGIAAGVLADRWASAPCWCGRCWSTPWDR